MRPGVLCVFTTLARFDLWLVFLSNWLTGKKPESYPITFNLDCLSQLWAIFLVTERGSAGLHGKLTIPRDQYLKLDESQSCSITGDGRVFDEPSGWGGVNRKVGKSTG